MTESRLPIFRLPIATLIWVVLAFVFSISTWATYAAKGSPEPFGEVLWWAGAEWLFYGAFAPLVFWLARRVNLTRANWPRSMMVLLLGWLLFHLMVQTSFTLADVAVPGLSSNSWSDFGPHFQILLFRKAGISLVVFAGMVAVSHLGELYLRVLDRERAAAELESALTQSRLEVLKGQLQPHFLFNTLNTATALVRDDPEGAERVLARLGDLLRMSLQEGEAGEVPLQQEVEFLRNYVEIQKVRFADRLKVSLEIDATVLRALVPTLLLQPLVENAIRHGIEPQSTMGTVTVSARRVEDQLEIVIQDDGVGIGEDGTNGHDTNGHGVGLRNTRQRLEQLYHADQAFTVRPGVGGGTEVRIRLPLQMDEGR